jgi:hypothetical protein
MLRFDQETSTFSLSDAALTLLDGAAKTYEAQDITTFEDAFVRVHNIGLACGDLAIGHSGIDGAYDVKGQLIANMNAILQTGFEAGFDDAIMLEKFNEMGVPEEAIA